MIATILKLRMVVITPNEGKPLVGAGLSFNKLNALENVS